MGHALRLRGADVRFLTCGGGLEVCDRANTWESPPPPCRTCAHYVRTTLDAHGFDQAELASNWRDADRSWPELDELSLAELEDVEHEGVPLGRLVAIPVRWFLMRDDLTEDVLAALTYRRFLRSARAILRARPDRPRPRGTRRGAPLQRPVPLRGDHLGCVRRARHQGRHLRAWVHPGHARGRHRRRGVPLRRRRRVGEVARRRADRTRAGTARAVPA